jgi:hypothetical protein
MYVHIWVYHSPLPGKWELKMDRKLCQQGRTTKFDCAAGNLEMDNGL